MQALIEDPEAGPATVTPWPGVAMWVQRKAFCLRFPGGNWNVMLRPADPDQTRWLLYAVPRGETRPYDRSEDGHLPIATGTDPEDLATFGRRWATLASDMAHRSGAAIYVGLSVSVAPCAIHGRQCDSLPRCDRWGASRRCDILSHPEHRDSDTRRDSDSDKEGGR